MATDGADFKRRVKYHGKTYTGIKNGSTLEVAGLARKLAFVLEWRNFATNLPALRRVA